MDRYDLSLKVIGISQTVIWGLVAVILGGRFILAPNFQPGEANFLAIVTILAATNATYYLTFHQLLKKRYFTTSSLIQILISALTLMLIIVQTGGLESPYYALWLVVIITLGVFGFRYTATAILATSAYYVYQTTFTHVTEHQLQNKFLGGHAVQLIITIAAGLLSHAIWSRNLRSQQQTETLAGRLKQETFKAQTVMQHMGEGAILAGPDRRIQFINPAAQEFTGWEAGTAEGLDWQAVLKLETNGEDPLAKIWQSPGPITLDRLDLISRSGRRRPITLSLSPIKNKAGGVEGAVAILRDVTKEQALERQRSEFISTASHEMRTPLTAIEGYISLALNPEMSTLDERAKGYLQKAYGATKHLGMLFRDLLSVTKVEEQSMSQRLETVNIGQLLKEVVDGMQIPAQQRGLKLEYRIGNQEAGARAIQPLYFVSVDEERLREVVMNLIDNAFKFTKQGGVTVTMKGNDKVIQVDVTDTGVGIAGEDIPHLFQKFYRIEDSATRETQGTGLGLYLCRSIIERFNGRIWVASTPGQGSTFSFNLPRVRPEEVANSTPKP